MTIHALIHNFEENLVMTELLNYPITEEEAICVGLSLLHAYFLIRSLAIEPLMNLRNLDGVYL